MFTLTDVNSRFGLAPGSAWKSSRGARRFFDLACAVFPAPIGAVLSDNGSEFEGAFRETVAKNGITRWYTWPHTPKMNAHCERFNRTLQEEFVDYPEDLLFEDLPAFNAKLADWLIGYNSQRPHPSLGQQSPLQFIVQHHPECQRYWTHTPS